MCGKGLKMKCRLLFILLILGWGGFTSANARAIVEYSDSSDWYKKTVITLKANERINLNVEKYGWKKCEILANDTKSALYGECYLDNKKSVLFECYGDEANEISLIGSGMISIKLICTYK